MNATYILMIIFALSILDSSLTWLTMKNYNAKFPDKDVCSLEKNPLTRFLCHKLGFNFGMPIAALISLAIMYITFTYLFSYEMKFVIIGFLLMVNYTHYINLQIISAA